MNDCERLSDRMPEVALERASWTAGEADHLETCAECRAEWRLVLAAHALEQSAPVIADPSALAAMVQRRLADERAGHSRARRLWSFTGAAVAAAAIVIAVVMGGEAGPAPTERTAAQADALIPLPELEGLETAQLDTLLQSLDRPLDNASTLDASTLGEYEDGALEQVFATWEG